jgi:predicted dehydrogenase
VVSLVGRTLEPTRKVAEKYGIGHATTELAESLARNDVDAVILCTPTQMHAAQTIQCLEAGKHVQVEIPLCDNLAEGEARSWTDHLLWHHAAHTVDLFAYQAGPIVQANAIQGPIHPELGIAMDMSIQLKAESGAICTLSLSFNNDGPLGTFFRYICDNGTWIARYDDLVTGKEEPVDLSGVAVSSNGIELQDREFVAAIREGREPNSSVAQVLPCYRVLDALEKQLG